MPICQSAERVHAKKKVGKPCFRGNTAQGGREPFWNSHKEIFYVHNCITYGSIKFWMAVIGCSGLL